MSTYGPHNLYKLKDHPEHEAALPAHTAGWIANALSTEPADLARVVPAMRGMYEAADLTPPSREVFVGSPYTALIAGGVAAGVWWARQNPDRHVEVFGSAVDEAVLRLAAKAAVQVAVEAGMRALVGEAPIGKPLLRRDAGDATFAAPREAISGDTDTAVHEATSAVTSNAITDATFEAAYVATGLAVNDISRLVTYAATSDVTDMATVEPTNYAVWRATEEITRTAVSEATDSAISAAIQEMISGGTTDAISEAASEATFFTTNRSTYAAASATADAATDDATNAAIRATANAVTAVNKNAVRAAIDSATNDTVKAAIERATAYMSAYAVNATTRKTTLDTTGGVVDQITDDATSEVTPVAFESTRGSTHDPAYEAISPVVNFFLVCVERAWRMYDGGSDWSAWPCHLSAYDDVFGLDLPVFEQWRHYRDAAIFAGPRIVHANFWIVSDRQATISLDEENRLHHESGPAKTWGDGWSEWYWHGIRVRRDLIEDGGWSAEQILAEENTEIRRAAIERIGWPQFVEAAGLELISEEPDPSNAPHMLRLYDAPEGLVEGVSDDTPSVGNTVRVLVMTNGSPDRSGELRLYGETVPGNIGTAVEAAAWQYGWPVEAYRAMQRRT